MIFLRWFLIVIAFMGSLATFAASPLVGSRWRVEITPEGETIPHHVDQLRFQEQNFTSAIFERRGFPTSPYTQSKTADGSVVWDAMQASDTEGNLFWHGELQGEAMTGTLVWKKTDGTIINHSLAGSPAVEEAAPSAEEAKGTSEKATGKKSRWGCSFNPF